MAHIATHPIVPGFFKPVVNFFNALGGALVAIAENNPRLREYERLQRLSDAELARRGLSRTNLVEHVFRGAI